MIENNDLLNLLKLAVTTLDSCNTNQRPPDNESGIADSGLCSKPLGQPQVDKQG